MSRHAGVVALGLVAALGWATRAAAAEDEEAFQSGKTVFLRGGGGVFPTGLGVVSHLGPSWGVGVAFEPSRFFAVELSYEGSRNFFYDGERYDHHLLRNGVSVLARLSLPVSRFVRPFVGLGVGGSLALEPLYDDSFGRMTLLGEVPLSAGIEFGSGRLRVGARTAWRLLVGSQAKDHALWDYLDLLATAGLRF
ncbi:hypothetical protein [Melittangium boletus]|uniref:hypothetical protein n=1 Tax=Melittangium boletus TaxID=83453 RepID=UPI003DA6948B